VTGPGGRLRGWLELGRISNAPTCVSNVLAGCAIGFAAYTPEDVPWLDVTVVVMMIAVILLMYLGGMVLNDVADAPIDATERPERPIPSGRVCRRTAGVVAALLIGGSVGLAFTVSSPVGNWCLALAVAVVLYDLLHKQAPWTVVLMGACRGLVYVAAAVAIHEEADALTVAVPAGMLTLFIVGVTAAARSEHADGATGGSWIARGLVVLPFVPALVLHAPEPAWPIAVGVVLAGWMIRSAVLLRGPNPRRREAVMGWLAGLCLIDAYVLALTGHLLLVVVALVCFIVTMLAHRVILGT
jgi:4-hydroxybenzoate polyprenyltransferase